MCDVWALMRDSVWAVMCGDVWTLMHDDVWAGRTGGTARGSVPHLHGSACHHF